MQTEEKDINRLTEMDGIKPKVRGFVTISEEERLLEDYKRSGLEKLQLFTKMLRRNAMFNSSTRIAWPQRS